MLTKQQEITPGSLLRSQSFYLRFVFAKEDNQDLIMALQIDWNHRKVIIYDHWFSCTHYTLLFSDQDSITVNDDSYRTIL
jgi:hypothetical protein